MTFLHRIKFELVIDDFSFTYLQNIQSWSKAGVFEISPRNIHLPMTEPQSQSWARKDWPLLFGILEGRLTICKIVLWGWPSQLLLKSWPTVRQTHQEPSLKWRQVGWGLGLACLPSQHLKVLAHSRNHILWIWTLHVPSIWSFLVECILLFSW